MRKEEEELCRQEQLEEDKRRKKENEKQKFREKKEQGKILTNKQKEEARRLEAMRNQMLMQGCLFLLQPPLYKLNNPSTTKNELTNKHMVLPLIRGWRM